VGVYLYVIIVLVLLIVPSLAFVLVNLKKERATIRARRGFAHEGAIPGVILPSDARPPVSVFFEGVELEDGRDYELRGQQIVLRTELQPYSPSVWREFVTTATGVGFYGRGAHLDVRYELADGGHDSTLLPVIPVDAPVESGALGWSAPPF
jgi:hypothetical protein